MRQENGRWKFVTFLFTAAAVKAAEHTLGFLLNDGSTYKRGYVNGYPYEETMKVGADNQTIEKFEVWITAQKPATVESLFIAVGMGYECQKSFPYNPMLNGKSLLTGFGDVRGNFNVCINGQQPFQDGAISDKQVTAGQKVRLIALPGCRLIPK